jgi:hypothetical protein
MFSLSVKRAKCFLDHQFELWLNLCFVFIGQSFVFFASGTPQDDERPTEDHCNY